ncbi:hemopexin [Dunckerocampus dactyliophorus]|uniref:hemopexin n=1 Tax=Dunckerocampus dactyliophorus TaxID=161453 RepID=UPI002405FCAA|nr:hemopexin [Dunckerocampus dactyliophorus]
MNLLVNFLCVCLALALAHADHHEELPDRCHGLEMDAAAVNEDGIPYFFKGHFLFKGFDGKAEMSNETFAELDDDHHVGHVDAAFRMHYEDSPTDHDRMFFFLDNKVFSYHEHKLEDGYPKDISEVFPGIPDHLEAAVQCPKPECDEDSVIFFKGHDIYHYHVKSKAVDKKEFKSMPNCTSAFRYMGHYYCFHGHMFSKFDQTTGEIQGKYPKEASEFFAKCPKYGEDSDHVERERCSRVHLDAITSDDAGDFYAFRGNYFLHKYAGNHTLTADTIEHAFKEVHNDVDAVFSYHNHLYMIKGDQVFAYKVSDPHTLMEGFPKPIKEELGLDGPIDAAFVCEDHHIAHLIKGQHIYDVELDASPRVPTNERSLALFKKVEGAMCGPKGVNVIVGNHFYHFDSIMLFVAAKSLPEQHTVSIELFECDH